MLFQFGVVLCPSPCACVPCFVGLCVNIVTGLLPLDSCLVRYGFHLLPCFVLRRYNLCQVVGLSSIPSDLVFEIFSYADARTLLLVSQVNSVTRAMARAQWKARVHATTRRHIKDVAGFYDLLGRVSGIVSGSTALAVLMWSSTLEGPWTRGRDLDLYVPSTDALATLLRFLEADEGYRQVPVPEDDCERYIETAACVASITRLRRRGADGLSVDPSHVDVICAKDNSSTLPIVAFWGTLVMNYISSTAIVSLYPHMTLDGRGIENPHADKTRVRGGMDKYRGRGFDLSFFAHNVQVCNSSSSYCPSVLRFTEDAQCMTASWSDRPSLFEGGTKSLTFSNRCFSTAPSFWVWSVCSIICASSTLGYATGRL